MPELDQLPTVATVADDDYLPIYDVSETNPVKLKRITFDNFKGGFSGFNPDQFSVVEQSNDKTLVESDCNKVYLVDGAHTLTLPDLTSTYHGDWVWVKNTASTAVNVTVTGTIADGDVTLTQGDAVLLVFGSLSGFGDVWYEMASWS